MKIKKVLTSAMALQNVKDNGKMKSRVVHPFTRSPYMRTVIALFFLLYSVPVFAGDIPANAHKRSYGSGWDCDRGYFRKGDQCEKVIIPENAKLSYTGSSWECERAYVRKGDQCEKVIIPENGKLTYTGSSWECERGYVRKGDRCEKVIIPENAKLSYTGSSWECERGYVRKGDQCEKLIIPENAKLSYSGSSWECERGYVRKGDRCEEVIIPENGKLSSGGSGWECQDKYKLFGNKCVPMTAAEVAQQQAQVKKIMAQLEENRKRWSRGGDCSTEYRSGAKVCVEVESVNLDCNKDYSGESYRDCDASVSYEVETDYQGGSYLDVEVECKMEIEYKGRNYYSTQSDSSTNDENHSLYAHGSEDETMNFNFSFSLYKGVYSVKVDSVKCEINSVDLR